MCWAWLLICLEKYLTSDIFTSWVRKKGMVDLFDLFLNVHVGLACLLV